MKVSNFDFELPAELIATHPLDRRDASRMLVVKPTPALAAGAEPDDKVLSIQDSLISDSLITDFISHLRAGDVVVFNNSKVIPARFNATAPSGKVYEITLHTNKNENIWFGFAKQFNKLNIGDILILDDEKTQIKIISKNDDSGLELEFLCDDVFAVLDRVGKMPLPPYMHRDEESDDRDRYQTVYAETLGSMAAPTAGLHFTPELIAAIQAAGAKVVNITLHIGAGTWLPVKSDDTSDHKMHSEFGIITPDQMEIINSARRVIAIGTTSLRLLESANHKAFNGATNIFITPGYKFNTVDVLLTNFHLPKSTLFMLVSAFAGLPEMKAAYAHAVAERYRFFSYGDCCLLFKKEN
ncbi:MAG: tRNA preQ1(34) S-adenosylmethionine ribosyltransferase-isomerase QueA [Rickettsiales bacterium]|jgi:S-adenosylmethionine:tRNA ribosyltransferase-isomerase|nr:tRNA preQ1(34) S-adenosylmethionine ribosyltransferase-isomerase QueA [Rickettsiales bacterium]